MLSFRCSLLSSFISFLLLTVFVSHPHTQKEYFQDDVFCDTRSAYKWAEEAADWFGGKNAPVQKVTLSHSSNKRCFRPRRHLCVGFCAFLCVFVKKLVNLHGTEMCPALF